VIYAEIKQRTKAHLRIKRYAISAGGIVMNKEYWQRKADLCQKIGIEQLMAGDIKNGTRNLKRMVRAMEEINLINYMQERDEDKSAADMWASLIASGVMLAGEGESNE
jgi:hypothetical protein